MSTLALILADFHLAPQVPGRTVALPTLPALGRLLARATRTPLPGGWRPWLIRQLCAAQPALEPAAVLDWVRLATEAPAAVVAAARAAQPEGRYCWFATPVHCFAGIQSVNLHPNGLLTLAPAAQAALAESFRTVFDGSGLELIPTGRRDLLLAGDAAAAGSDGVSTGDPARWLGRDPSRGLPSGPGAARLRRLGSEIELWLHEHPVNRERVARGELPVTALWLWGGGAAARPQSPVTQPAQVPGVVVQADDVFGEAVAKLCGVRWQVLPGAVRSVAEPVAPVMGAAAAVATHDVVPRPAVAAARADAATAQRDAAASALQTIAILPTATGDPLAALQGVDAGWIAPALARLKGGALNELQLLAGEQCYRLTRPRLWRAWRRDALWWEALATPEADEDGT